MSESLRLGRYRHFKGKYYEVLGVARHSETMYGERGLWVRPLSMFTQMVERDGKLQPRFAYVEEVQI